MESNGHSTSKTKRMVEEETCVEDLDTSIRNSIENGSDASEDEADLFMRGMQRDIKNMMGQDSSSSSSDDESSSSEAEVVGTLAAQEEEDNAKLDEDEQRAEEEGEDVDVSQSDDSSSDSEDESEMSQDPSGDSEMDDFVVPDDQDPEEYKGGQKKRGDKKQSNGHSKSREKNPFIHSAAKESYNEGDEDEEEDIIEPIEYPLEKNFPIPDHIMRVYKGFFGFHVMDALMEDYKRTVIKNMSKLRNTIGDMESKPSNSKSHLAELADLKEKLENHELQLNSEKCISGYISNLITLVFRWILNNTNKKWADEIHVILVDQEGDEKPDFMQFEKSANHSSSCKISGHYIKSGQAWVMRCFNHDGTVVASIVDARWVHFFSFWQYLAKHKEVIKDYTKRHFKNVPMKPFPTKKLIDLINSESTITRFIRAFMASFAYFYKILSGTKEGEVMATKIDSRWYTVCGFENGKAK